MKKLLIAIVAATILFGCQKNIIGDFEKSTFVDETPDLENKKGAAFTNRALAWSHRTSDLKAHWMYSWGNTLREEIPENVEFVPMFWGAGSVTQENIDRIKALGESGEVKYVLGFNEPDGAAQANMTVDEAIALWPKLEEIGLPLASPATVNPNNEWMQEFMAKATELDLRIDYIAVHHYGGTNVLAFVNKLKETYEAFGKPIWVTEFAVADWNATAPTNNRYSEAEVADFMKGALEALDDIDWVFRYAWFDGRNAPLYTSALFDDSVRMTTVGQIYADNKPNVIIGPGVDTEFEPVVDPDELLLNGNFEAGQIAPWGGFKNGVVGSATSEPYTGKFSGRIENGDGSLFYVIDVLPDSTYTLKFYSKWRDEVAESLLPRIRDNEGNALLFTLPEVAKTTDWTESTYEFTVPSDVSELKMVWYKANGFPPFFLDDVSLKLKK